ncbi:outer membrane beta-barrel protein [uncultured Umboniibacter sp.]|uniref:outer membrane beta-barrel protein n=1 Tax=uncultured Umboniibacter sp. TaxID=1798917 RepID=UPI00261A1CD3|nr:outer membrane beta-barrel protein [uncultured Umboniibacter sp.]
MKRTIQIALIALACPMAAVAENQFRIGGEFSASQETENDFGDSTAVQAQFVGEYIFNQTFSINIEVGKYVNSADDVDVEVSALLLQSFATLYLPINDSFRLYGGAGYYWMNDADLCGDDNCITFDDFSTSDYAIQGGLEFGDLDGWAFAVEYEGLQGNDDFENSIGFRFGYAF